MIRIIRRGPDGSETEAEDLPDAPALQYLCSGQGVLAGTQKTPPFIVLDHLAVCLTDIDLFGPAATEAVDLDWLAKNLFAAGVRQNVVAGSKLDWYVGSARLFPAAVRRLCMTPGSGPDLYEQVNGVWKTYLKSLRVMSVDEFRSRHSLRETENWLGGEPSASRRRVSPGESWKLFGEQLGRLALQRKAIVAAALADGHILMSEDFGATSRLVHPSSATLRLATRDSRYAYCFSGDLPKAWHDIVDPLHRQRIKAAKWMVRAHKKIKNDGKRATRIQLIEVAMPRFHLTRNAAEDAWDIAREDIKVSRGDFDGDIKVNINDINAIR